MKLVEENGKIIDKIEDVEDLHNIIDIFLKKLEKTNELT